MIQQQRKEYFNKKIEAKEKEEEEELANKEILQELEQHLDDEEMEEEFENINEVVNINEDIAMEAKEATIQSIVPEDKPIEIQKKEEHKENKKEESEKKVEKSSITEEEYKEIEKAILDNITKCDCELDFNNLEISQKHIEAIILYLRKLTSYNK